MSMYNFMLSSVGNEKFYNLGVLLSVMPTCKGSPNSKRCPSSLTNGVKEGLFLFHANSKGTDKPVHPLTLTGGLLFVL